jgi:hypothetical protein
MRKEKKNDWNLMNGNVSGIGSLEMVNDLWFTVVFLLSFLVLYIVPGMIGKVVKRYLKDKVIRKKGLYV